MRYILAIFFFFLIASCSKQRAALYHFNQVNDLVKKTESYYSDYMKMINDAMSNEKPSDNATRAELLRQKLVQRVEIYINRTKKIHSLKGDDSYRYAAAIYFKGTRDILENELKQMIAIHNPGVVSEQMADSASLLSVNFENKRKNYVADFIKVRDAFAKNHEISILTDEKSGSEK